MFCYGPPMGRKRKHNKNYPRHLHVKKGWFYYVVYIPTPDNPTLKKTRWLPLKTQDEATALKRWAEIEAAFVNETRNFDATKIKAESNSATLKQLVDRFIEEVVKYNAEKTRINYKRMAKEIINEFGANTPINRITRQMIIRWHDNLRSTPYEANRRKALIHLLLQRACDWGYITVNPAFRIKKHKESKFKLKLTSDILFNEIYPVAKPMLKTAIMLAFHLVQHSAEVRKLEWKNFNFDRKVATFVRGKTGEDIIINFSENEALCKFLEYIKTNRKELSPYLIYHREPKKGWMPYKSLRSLWYAALEDAGYKKTDFKFKEIRHLANTCMKDAGITADKRKRMTGHVLATTNEVYTHPTGMDTIDSSRALSRFKPKKF